MSEEVPVGEGTSPESTNGPAKNPAERSEDLSREGSSESPILGPQSQVLGGVFFPEMRIEQEPPREGEEEDEELVGAPEEGGLDGAIGAVAPDGTWRDGVTTQVPERFAREPAADEAGDAGAAPGAPETWEHEVKRLGFAMMATLVVWVIAPWLLYLAWGMLTREPEPGAKPRGVGLALLAMVQGLGQSIAVAIWLATYVRLVLR